MPIPFNAGATASPALWAGLPVLTRMNSRKAAVILADMSPDKARQATELMAGQGQDITLGGTAPSLPSLP